MLKRLRERLEALITTRSAKWDEAKGLLDLAEMEKRDLSAEEDTKFLETKVELDKLDADIKELEERIADVEALEARETKAAEAVRTRTDDRSKKSDGPGVSVGDEATTYRKRGRHSFFADAFAARFKGDDAAGERLTRHAREMDKVYPEFRHEERAGTTANYAGQVVPQYLIDEYADIARAKRPFLNEVRQVPLPDQGMEVHIGKGTTGTSVAAQATENTTVSNTDYDDTDLSVPVRTYAGMQLVSRQAVERGGLVDEILAEDLLSAYYTAVDAGAIASDGTSGTHKGVLSASGINAVTYTDASPTAAELYPKIADAAWNQIPTQLFAGTDALFMHPRRFAFLMASVDSQGRPLVVPAPQGPMNAQGGGGGGPAYGPTGYSIQGVPTFTDANIPAVLGAGTNEDRIIALVKREVIFWEDPDAPIQLRFDETEADQLSVLFVAYGYSAFTAERRPKAVSVISGTGLIAPTF